MIQFFLWLCLISLRLWLVFSPGYLHPDEFFQSSEPIAGSSDDYEV
jgi:hypothetical protein